MKKGVKELTEGMQRLCAVANRVVSENGKVSRIEIDLLLDNLRSLYDTALRLAESDSGKWNDDALLNSTMMATRAAMSTEPEQKEPLPEPKPEPVPAPAPIPEPEPEPAPEPQPVKVVEEIEDSENSLLFDEVVIEPEPEPIPEPAPEPLPEPEPVPEPAPEPAPEPEPVAEPTLFEEPKPAQASLLDYLKHPVEETPAVRTIGDTLSGTATAPSLERKVTDLRTVININDKFSFMNELFHGNLIAYNNFIMQLNDISARDEALRLVDQMKEQYKWSDDSLAVKSFRKIFDKKF